MPIEYLDERENYERRSKKLSKDEFLVLEVDFVRSGSHFSDRIVMFSNDIPEAMLHAYLVLLGKIPDVETKEGRIFAHIHSIENYLLMAILLLKKTRLEKQTLLFLIIFCLMFLKV